MTGNPGGRCHLRLPEAGSKAARLPTASSTDSPTAAHSVVRTSSLPCEATRSVPVNVSTRLIP